MAENDCVKREVGGGHGQYDQADHHEWRFIKDVFGSPNELGDRPMCHLYHCIFCLETRRVKRGTPTEHR